MIEEEFSVNDKSIQELAEHFNMNDYVERMIAESIAFEYFMSIIDIKVRKEENSKRISLNCLNPSVVFPNGDDRVEFIRIIATKYHHGELQAHYQERKKQKELLAESK